MGVNVDSQWQSRFNFSVATQAPSNSRRCIEVSCFEKKAMAEETGSVLKLDEWGIRVDEEV